MENDFAKNGKSDTISCIGFLINDDCISGFDLLLNLSSIWKMDGIFGADDRSFLPSSLLFTSLICQFIKEHEFSTGNKRKINL